jgi:hypothetical protein
MSDVSAFFYESKSGSKSDLLEAKSDIRSAGAEKNWCLCYCAFGNWIGEIVKCLPIGRSRFKFEREQLRIKGNVVAGNEERVSACDDVSEDLLVSGDAYEYALLGGKSKGLILKLETISVDCAEDSDCWNLTDVNTTIEDHYKMVFVRSKREGHTMLLR